MLPHGLKKLHLSGMGFPWEYMVDAIASLPSLEVLKLRCYAFRGLKCEIHERSFLKLEYLAIEDSDLVAWNQHLEVSLSSNSLASNIVTGYVSLTGPLISEKLN